MNLKVIDSNVFFLFYYKDFPTIKKKILSKTFFFFCYLPKQRFFFPSLFCLFFQKTKNFIFFSYVWSNRRILYFPNIFQN